MSGVFRTFDPRPLSTQRVRPTPHQKHSRRAVRGWGVNISEDARHWIGLLQHNPSSMTVIQMYKKQMRRNLWSRAETQNKILTYRDESVEHED